MRSRRVLLTALVLAGGVLAFGLGRATARDRPGETILSVWGVAGVLTGSGGLWQYLPDEKKWVTIDEAMKREGRETHILPLPVPVASIRSMESWGFLVTKEGKAWLYEMESNKWVEIGTP